MGYRLISADMLKREMWRRCGETDIEIDKGRAKWDCGLWIRYKVFEECIALTPTIEAVPLEDYRSMEQTVHKLTQAIAEAEPKHGRWIIMSMYEYRCSLCGAIHMRTRTNYCPNCGTRMDGGENG